MGRARPPVVCQARPHDREREAGHHEGTGPDRRDRARRDGVRRDPGRGRRRSRPPPGPRRTPPTTPGSRTSPTSTRPSASSVRRSSASTRPTTRARAKGGRRRRQDQRSPRPGREPPQLPPQERLRLQPGLVPAGLPGARYRLPGTICRWEPPRRRVWSSPLTGRRVPVSRARPGASPAALGLRYLDTGAMYRALTWWFMAQKADTADAALVAARADGAGHRGLHRPGRPVDPGQRPRRVPRDPHARGLRPGQRGGPGSRGPRSPDRQAARDHRRRRSGIVAEGRDIGTVVAPGTPSSRCS